MTTYAFPGYINDVIPLTGRIEASWANAIRDRTNQVFASTAARDLAIPEPHVGQVCIITTGSGAGEYVYSGTTVGWTKPWSLPWGIVALGTSTTDQNGYTSIADVPGMSATFTSLANRTFRTSIYLPRVQRQTNFGEDTLTLANGSNAVLTTMSHTGDDNEVWAPYLSYVFNGTGGSVTHKARYLSAGALSHSTQIFGATNPGRLLIEDIGPAGAPS